MRASAHACALPDGSSACASRAQERVGTIELDILLLGRGSDERFVANRFGDPAHDAIQYS